MSRHENKYTETCVSIWLYVLSNTQSTFETQFMKKLSTEAELRKSVAYIKISAFNFIHIFFIILQFTLSECLFSSLLFMTNNKIFRLLMYNLSIFTNIEHLDNSDQAQNKGSLFSHFFDFLGIFRTCLDENMDFISKIWLLVKLPQPKVLPC